jgi:hypothetical protein
MLAALERLSRRRALGGNTWIALVAFALIGIVTLQLGLLKLNAGIGRALEHEALLQRENAALSIENSELAAGDRVTSRAVTLGMEAIPTGALHFLMARPWIDTAKSMAALSTPAHASTTALGEASPGSSSTVTSSSPSSASAESSTAEPATSASTESSSAPATTPPASGESPGRASGESGRTSGESTSSSTSPSPSTSGSSPATAPAGGGSAEGTPAGGTQAGSSG